MTDIAASAQLIDPAAAETLDVVERYGYWNAGPDENATVGLEFPAR
jgi:hypothetical protein